MKIYVFSHGRYPFTDNFREVEDKVELVALPAAIYDAYQKVLPKRKDKLFEQEREQAETKIPRRLVRGAGRYNGIIMLKILYYLINVFFRYILNFCPDFGDASPCSHVRQLANSGNFGYARL